MIISIIIPTFNEEEYLPILLKSIEEQNFNDYEIIVADANSTDKTREIAEEYNCKIVKGGLPGIGRNNGAKIALGKYLLFLDSDLKLTENYLKELIEEFEFEKLGIAITQMEALSEKKEDKILHDLANWFMIAVENIKPHGAGCYGIISKKSLHEECGGFDESLNFGEDTDYIERLAKKEPFKVLRKPRIGVSTRRLEEEGLYTLLYQYGKSTVNDFRGKRTSAEELNYSFGHSKIGFPRKRWLDKLTVQSERLKTIKTNVKISKNVIKSSISKNKVKDGKNRIYYSVCGEGMGHAIRSGVIISHLKKKYDVFVFSSDRAYKYLNEKFDNVYEIGGFNTVYENNKVNDKKTLFKAIKANPINLKEGYNVLYKKSRVYPPNIIISDFENYSSMLSKIINVPLISLDNIHMITQTRIDYPPNHQKDLLKAKGVIKSYILRPKIHILTSFFYPPVRSNKKALIYPPVLREEILKLIPETEDHILVYQTSKDSINIIKKLKNINEKFIVYGFNEDLTDKNLTFKKFNEDIFYKDISTAKAVICNGGFTLISEAIHLKKPIFSIPALGNFEQILNGFYVQKLGYGEYHEKITKEKINKFLKNLPKYQEKLNTLEKTDNEDILKGLEYYIKKYSK